LRRPIVGYHQDEDGHWVAELECGHTQHVRHDPPWQVRVWVTTPDGRDAHLGTELDCILCHAADDSSASTSSPGTSPANNPASSEESD
jgi:hypothetical protein